MVKFRTGLHFSLATAWLFVFNYFQYGLVVVGGVPSTQIVGPSIRDPRARNSTRNQDQYDPFRPVLPEPYPERNVNGMYNQNPSKNRTPYPDRNGDRYSPNVNNPDLNRDRYPDRGSGDRYGSVTGDRYQQHPGGSNNRYPDRNGGGSHHQQYPGGGGGDRDRYPDRNNNGDRYQPDRNRDRYPGSDNGQGSPEIACYRCSRCKKGYCRGSSNDCC